MSVAETILVRLIAQWPIVIEGLLGQVTIMQDEKTGEKIKRIEMADGSVSVTVI